jgi:hypothetical protein
MEGGICVDANGLADAAAEIDGVTVTEPDRLRSCADDIEDRAELIVRELVCS